MGIWAKAWNPDLHAGGGGRSDPGILIQAGGGANGPKTSSKTGPAFHEHSLAGSLKAVTSVMTQPSEVRPRSYLPSVVKMYDL